MNDAERETLELITTIAGQKMLRLEQCRDEYRHWRAGIEWYSADKLEYVCEQPTLLGCLRMIKKYMDEHPNREPLNESDSISESLERQRERLAKAKGLTIAETIEIPEEMRPPQNK